MSLIDVAQAQQRLFSLTSAVETEDVPLAKAHGRWLSRDVMALRDQPWSDLSAMDGYAIRHASLPGPWTVIGESAAGGDCTLEIGANEAVRIFTGAAMPKSADCVLIQEEAEIREGQLVLTGEGPDRPGKHLRARGSDFATGALLLAKGSKVGARQVALAAIGGHGTLPIHRRIKVALFSTGNELVEPGKQARATDLPASNGVMLRAMLAGLPVTVDDLGIIPDDLAAQTEAFRRALAADVIVTTGGASVGDHDLVKPAFEAVGGSVDFWRIALRPGKPLIAGHKDRTLFLGLPGNPVSAFVTATLFLLPLVRHMSGANDPLPSLTSTLLAQDMPATSTRANYIRAIVQDGIARPCASQDSAALLSLANANALLVRPPHSGPAKKGDRAEVILLS
ncbi:MAG: molybdopterin molybdotransferase MoeA [Alphaproteobacteria bacterium]|nr:molybdopterin molybdotransferase MoeA [Alphaproteobacteria bacterium]